MIETYTTQILIFLAVLGTCLGSFLNVLIHRLPKKEGIVLKRSYCPHCKEKLRVIELIPILSYIFQLGKCRHCQKKISFRYFLVETLSAITLPLMWTFFGHGLLFYKTSLFLFALIVVFFTDMETYLIPDKITLPMVMGGLIFAVIEKNILDSIYGLLVGFLTFVIIGVLAKLYYKKDAMGGGDMKLGAAMGAFWGLKITIMMCYFSFLIGGLLGFILLITHLKERSDHIPFGPAMVLGSITSLAFGEKLWSMYFG